MRKCFIPLGYAYLQRLGLVLERGSKRNRKREREKER